MDELRALEEDKVGLYRVSDHQEAIWLKLLDKYAFIDNPEYGERSEVLGRLKRGATLNLYGPVSIDIPSIERYSELIKKSPIYRLLDEIQKRLASDESMLEDFDEVLQAYQGGPVYSPEKSAEILRGSIKKKFEEYDNKRVPLIYATRRAPSKEHFETLAWEEFDSEQSFDKPSYGRLWFAGALYSLIKNKEIKLINIEFLTFARSNLALRAVVEIQELVEEDFTYDKATHQISYQGTSHKLTKREYQVFFARLVERSPSLVLTSEFKQIFPNSEQHSIDSVAKYLRRKLGLGPGILKRTNSTLALARKPKVIGQ